jgi:hypothetical protein
MPTQNVPTPITTAQHRAVATEVVAEASGLSPLGAALLVDAVDVATAAILGSIGLSVPEVRQAAAALWVV